MHCYLYKPKHNVYILPEPDPTKPSYVLLSPVEFGSLPGKRKAGIHPKKTNPNLKQVKPNMNIITITVVRKDSFQENLFF